MLSAADCQRLTAWAAKLIHPPRLVFLTNERPESRLFHPFLEALPNCLPQLRWTTEEVPAGDLPGLALGEIWRFHAVPEGKKLQFLEAILVAADGRSDLPPELAAQWAGLPFPPTLLVFVAAACPYCPQVIPRLRPLATAIPPPRIQVVEADLFPDWVRRYEIKAVPTVIINDLHRLTGNFALADLVDLAARTDPAQLPTDLLARMLKDGQAGRLGELMAAQGGLFPNFRPLLLHPELNLRLGAMVAWETVATAHPAEVEPVLEWLWSQFPAMDLTLQGDILYLIGEWGGPSWLNRLQEVEQQTAAPEVRESAVEARAQIRRRHG